jgi:maltose alpha-D-glucosyltransferase/alpha-amylase
MRETLGAYRETAQLLGRRTAEMHLALAGTDDPAFAPEAYSSFDRRSLYQSLRNTIGHVMRSLRTHRAGLPAEAAPFAKTLIGHEREILIRFEPLLTQPLHGRLRTRCHGDYHLAQVLNTGRDFVIIDFDGGGDHALPERRRKRSPLRDVAGMIRSFDYVTREALTTSPAVRAEDRAVVEPWARAWYEHTSAAFLRGYRERAAGAPFLPADEDTLAMLLARFILARAFHQLGSELSDQSPRVVVPLAAIVRMLALPSGS